MKRPIINEIDRHLARGHPTFKKLFYDPRIKHFKELRQLEHEFYTHFGWILKGYIRISVWIIKRLDNINMFGKAL